MILKLSLDLPEDRAFVKLIREIGKTTLRYLQVSQADVEDMEAILDELASNVIRHAHSQEGRFLVTLIYYADRIVITVTDRGSGFAFSDIPAPGTVRPDFDNEERHGGFGLKIVGVLANRLTFHCIDGKGTTVMAEKMLTYETPAASTNAREMDRNNGITATAECSDSEEFLSSASILNKT